MGVAESAHFWAVQDFECDGSEVDAFIGWRWARKAKYKKDGTLDGEYKAWGEFGCVKLLRNNRVVDKVFLANRKITWNKA
jgi:hypothetical protein